MVPTAKKPLPMQRASYLSKHIWEENESEQEEGNSGWSHGK